MKIFLTIGFFALLLFSFSQSKKLVIESIYKLEVAGEITDLPIKGGNKITINAKVKLIRNNRFCLITIIESSLNNEIFSSIAKSENEGDSLLFDIQQQKVFDISQKKIFWFSVNSVQGSDLNQDTLKLADTVVILSKKLNMYVSPSPTLKVMSKGILQYKTKKFIFNFISANKSNVPLEAIFDRCKNFMFTNQKTEFLY